MPHDSCAYKSDPTRIILETIHRVSDLYTVSVIQNVFQVNFFGYSAHETTIAALSIAMNVWEDVPPFYASGMRRDTIQFLNHSYSAFFFEKYHDGTVKIFFHNSTRSNFDNSTQNHYDITTNVCQYANDQTKCTLEELETSLMEVIPAVS